MDYSKLNGLLSSLEIEDTVVTLPVVEPVEKRNVTSEKKKINNFLCFRDIDLKKHLNQDVTNQNEIKLDKNNKKEYNNILNNRIFDIKNNNPTVPIMDFYPKFTRNEKSI
tara:strand:+ start:483 stop:812 length:330 start_codon:yes stop_codon:yes gene_type:complete